MCCMICNYILKVLLAHAPADAAHLDTRLVRY
jgi:hypothetical protein